MARTYRKLHYRPAAGCSVTGKCSFRSTRAARAFVAAQDVWNGDYVRVYRCLHCDWFHLTSKQTRWATGRRTAIAGF
jgi:hypothetical protein